MVHDGSGPLLLAVDGNSLLHRAHHAWRNSELRDADGRPTWALRGLIGFIARAAARLTPDAVLVGFDCGQDSVRRQAYPQYKGQRPQKPPELLSQLQEAPELLAAAGLTVAVLPGHEADDVLASAAALARARRWRCALMTSDRDSFALIDPTTSVLRVLNGGIDDSPLITPAALAAICGVRPDQYRDLAALRGDSSDNLPGVPGIGGKTAARLLSAFDTLDAAWAAVDAGRTDEVVAVVGEAAAGQLASPAIRELVERNRRLMALRHDLRLPALRRMAVPVDGQTLRAAFAARDIRLASSVWALVGEPPPAWHVAAVPPVTAPDAELPLPELPLPELPVDLAGQHRPGQNGPGQNGSGRQRPGRRGRTAVLPGQLTLF